MTVFNSPSPNGADNKGQRNHVKKAGNTGGVTVSYINSVWDPGGPDWIQWVTTNNPDSSGSSYPDPHGTGFGGCTGFRVVGTF